jgi:hypothetical protein
MRTLLLLLLATAGVLAPDANKLDDTSATSVDRQPELPDDGAVPTDWTPSATRFVQKQFVISMFVEPQWSPANYRRIAEANFTTVLHEHGCCYSNSTAVTSAQRLAAVRWCEQHGLDVIIKYNEAGWDQPPISNSSAVLGLNIKDEPVPTDSEYTRLRTMVSDTRAKLPGRLGFINMGGSIYDHPSIVEQYIERVQPDILCFDRYPGFGYIMSAPPNTVMRPCNDTYNESGVFRNSRDSYLHALSTVRYAALRANIPFWNYFKASGIYETKAKDARGVNPDPTESEIRWQIFHSLTYGARGVLWFYYTPEYHPDTGVPAWAGLVSDDGTDDRPTEHWWQAQRINGAVRALGPTLMRARSTGVVALRLDDGPEPAQLLAAQRSTLHNISRGSFTVGSFALEEGLGGVGAFSTAVLLANYAWTYTQTPTIDFGPSVEALEVDQHSGGTRPIVDAIRGLPGLQVGLLAGGGRLFVLRASRPLARET